MVQSTRLNKHVTTHGGRMKNGEDFALQRCEGTTTMQSSIHFISDSTFRADGCLHNVNEGTDRTVHFTEQLVCTIHVHVGEETVLVLDCTWIDPLMTNISASWCNFFGACCDENRHDINKVSTHIDSTFWTCSNVFERVERKASCF